MRACGVAEAPERPALRIVRPGEEQPREAPSVETPKAISVPQPQPSEGLRGFKGTLASLDPKVPRTSALLVCAGCSLAEQAVAFHHQAIAHAAPGTFRGGISPGLKSAEATRAWLQTHLDAHRKLAREHDEVTAPYSRAEDLLSATELAGAELDRATAVAGVAGLLFGDRATRAFKDASEIATRKDLDTPQPVIESSEYLLGVDVMGAQNW